MDDSINNTSISHCSRSKTLHNSLNIKSPSQKRKTKERPKECEIEYNTIVSPGNIAITLPIRTLSPNQFEPWQKKHKREKAQKRAVVFALIPIKSKIKTPCVLRFTRFAPKWLDAHDNLPMSLKKIVDQTCAEIVCDFVPGRADSYDCFEFEYDQKTNKEYAVKIEIIYDP